MGRVPIRSYVKLKCDFCGKEFFRYITIGEYKTHFCNRECADKYHSLWMHDNNPSKNPETAKKISKTNKGRIISEDARRKTSETLKKYFKNHPFHPWNTGLTAETHECIRRGAEKRMRRKEVKCVNCGKIFNVPIGQKNRKFCSHTCEMKCRNRTNNPMKDIKNREKVSIKYKTRWKDYDFRERMKRKHWGNEEYRERALKRLRSEEYRKKQSEISKTRWRNAEYREKMINLWKSEEYKEKILSAILKASFKRPTKIENRYLDFFKKYNLPFTYCGNGTLIIGGKCPDAHENNGRKICVEIAWKSQKEYIKKMPWYEWERQRIEHFKKYGWRCIVLWEDEIKNEEKLLKRIEAFLGENDIGKD